MKFEHPGVQNKKISIETTVRKKNNDRDGTTVRRHLVFLLDLPIVIIGKIYSCTIDQAADDFKIRYSTSISARRRGGDRCT